MNLRKTIKRYIPRCIPTCLFFLKHLIYFLYSLGRKSVSQTGQDFWVFGEVFKGKKNGYFVDIGAANGMHINNTFLLEKRYHWHGICIEANPSLFQILKRFRNSTCLNICVDRKEGLIDFALKGEISGIIDSTLDNSKDKVDLKQIDTIKLKTDTLASLLKKEKAPHTIDYLSIDVEGAEGRILSGFPFDEYIFNCMTIERPGPELKSILEKNGYIVVKEIPELDTFFIHKSFVEYYKSNVFVFWKRYFR